MSLLNDTKNMIKIMEEEDNTETKREYCNLLENSGVINEIPPFYSKKQGKQPTIKAMINNWAKEKSLISLRRNFPTIDDIDELRNSIIKSDFAGSGGLQKFTRSMPRTMKYSDYCKLRNKWPEHFSCYLTSKLFLDLCRPDNHTIYPEELFSHLSLQSYAIDYYRLMMKRDILNKGALEKKEFYQFIDDVSKNYSFLDEIIEIYPNNGKVRYVNYVTERFFVELDPLHSGSISIDNIMSSDLFLELIRLEEFTEARPNIFGKPKVLLYFKQFDEMDGDDDETLTKDDILHMPETRFTMSFVDQLFDSMVAYDKFDFRMFCRFKNAYTELGKPWANQLLFDIMDIDKNGVIDETEINYFYHDISRDFEDFFEADPPKFQDLVNELLDICSARTSVITKKEFIENSEVSKLIKNLIDLKALGKWERSDDVPSRGM